MGDLVLKGNLNLAGNLTLAASSGGKVKVAGNEVLLQLPVGQSHGQGPPVILPPPPATPTDAGTAVVVVSSLNQTVKVAGKPIVAQGVVMQGNVPTWPGTVLPSSVNATVRINRIAINVVGDKATIVASGASVPLTRSGQ